MKHHYHPQKLILNKDEELSNSLNNKCLNVDFIYYLKPLWKYRTVLELKKNEPLFFASQDGVGCFV